MLEYSEIKTNMDGESSSSGHNKMESILHQSSEPQNLPLEHLKEITNDFSDERLLGQGGFGKVYKGVLPNGDMIAVKKLMWTMTGIQDKQYENEARHLMRLKHPNIVRLVGYCSETEKELVLHNGIYVYAEKSERLLCFEYLPKGNLCGHLSDESSGLDWETRFQIIWGICCGLHYLHEEWQASTPIIHRDLKPSNILLDDNMVPKIADFGLSRLIGELQTRTITENQYGTLGYMSREYLDRGIITKELDIFSLGVIIIEIMTGNKHYPDRRQHEFIELVLENWRNRLQSTPGYTYRETDFQQIKRCIEIALLCVKLERTERPTTLQIIQRLASGGAESSNHQSIQMLLSGGAESSNEREAPTEALGCQLDLDYLDVIKVIGRGGSGIVQLVRHKFTGRFFALKVIQLSVEDSIRNQIAMQLKISLSTQCQYVVVFYEFFYFDGVISIVSEYMDGGSLAELLESVKTIPEDYLAAICKQILKGLIYLHNEKHIIHRDLKPSNILINHRGEVKISDFGASAIVSRLSEQRDTFVGTFTYMAPERICGREYGYLSDIWSLGLVILECATGNFPFAPCDSFYELLEAIVEQPPPFAPSDQFSPEFCSFISQCMQKDANDRSSAEDLLDHPFLSMYNGLHMDFASYFTTAGCHLTVPSISRQP